ncbi:MAG: ribbon-helix-helix protein, CopG family [Mesorhizobium sp.]|nr:MAG: ribbon-helix-helix protein, CopG family [Mesorhizobium sp.]
MKTQAMRTLTISLTPQQAARLQSAVEGGGYASNSEIVRDALRLWEHLKRAYADGMASGKPVEVEPAEFIRGLKAERRARG